MLVAFQCPSCGKLIECRCCGSERTLRCGNCDWERTPSIAEFTDDAPRVCLVCGNEDLWRQKDFSQRVGLLIVALGAILSSIAWWRHMPLTALGILMLFALADLILFAVMPDVLVCYRCRTRHRGVAAGTEHDGFDHELAERYRQERMRIEQAR